MTAVVFLAAKTTTQAL